MVAGLSIAYPWHRIKYPKSFGVILMENVRIPEDGYDDTIKDKVHDEKPSGAEDLISD